MIDDMTEPSFAPQLDLTADELLTTTRSVRKRLDLDRPVPLEVIHEALEVALQAPSGSNRQRWQWIVVTDPDVKRGIADYYKKSYTAYRAAQSPAAGDDPIYSRISSSSNHLADTMGEVPVLVIAAITVDEGGELPRGNQAGLWGSLLPAAWSFALALRARGLGSAWTTLHLSYEREIAALLGLPENVRQGVLLPVAYTVGTDFRPAPRAPLESVVHLNRW